MPVTKSASPANPEHDPDEILAGIQLRLREGGLIALVALCLYLSMALLSFNPEDPGWSYTGTDGGVTNMVGRSGA